MDAGALDTQQDAQVDRCPARVGLAAVTALLVPRQTLDPLQDGFTSGAALSRLAGRINTACGWRCCSIQMLNINTQKLHPLGSSNAKSVSTYSVCSVDFIYVAHKAQRQFKVLYIHHIIGVYHISIFANNNKQRGKRGSVRHRPTVKDNLLQVTIILPKCKVSDDHL